MRLYYYVQLYTKNWNYNNTEEILTQLYQYRKHIF